MIRLTRFQRWTIACAAALVALRMFFPIEHDHSGTLMQVMGITVVTAAIFVLAPSPDLRKLEKALLAGFLLGAYLAYVIIAAAILVPRFSPTSSGQLPGVDILYGSDPWWLPWWPLLLMLAAGIALLAVTRRALGWIRR